MKKRENLGSSTVRLTPSAKEKLSAIADRKRTSQSDAASRIITHYAQNDYDCEMSIPKSLNSMAKTLETHTILLNVVAGRTGRSEDFIKGLLREDRSMLSSNPDPAGPVDEDDGNYMPSKDHRLAEALHIIDQLLSTANQILAVDGRPVMQIRLQLQKFNQVKAEYEKLCM